MKSRFCILSGIYPPDTGGPAKFAKTFSQFLIRNGYQVRVISYTNSSTHVLRNDYCKIELISRKIPLPIRYARMLFRIVNAVISRDKIVANGCFIELSLLRIIFPFSYIVKVPGDIVWERARNLGITESNIDTFQTENLNWKYRIFRYLFTYSLLKSQRVVVPSTHLKELVISWGVQADKVFVIYNSVDTNRFIPLGGQDKNFDVLTVSRLVPWKNIEEVIRVCSSLGLSLGIVGDGPLRETLESLSSKSKSPVIFFGDVDQNKLIKLLQSANFFVLNSNFEATSYALIEAMSCGVIPISNDSTGSVEVIENKIDGILCGKSTGLTLETGLSLLSSNPDSHLLMAKNARSKVIEKFNIEVNFGKIRDLADA